MALAVGHAVTLDVALSTVRVYVALPLELLMVSVAVTTTLLKTPDWVGVPEMVPLDDIVRPSGKPVALHVYVLLGVAVNGPTLYDDPYTAETSAPGDVIPIAFTAVPDREICWVVLGLELRLLSVSVTVPVAAPDAGIKGIKVTLILQDWPGRSEKVVVQSPAAPPSVNEDAGVEVIVRPGDTAVSGVAVSLPLFKIVTDSAALVPSIVAGNVSEGAVL
jgi:hypothetical protein